ncbi:NAD(P)/FAD-dependent oxidoreductase [uncultured Leifsonia sp.]|uniref:flavin-containing monooxygenase n=1 Tax=uncultured Leifsonia sp. TaxID=340359 RepID=UPI0026010DB4|nr:NAD(P)/FAD-dependent oxidoreductase [uncultured Leifsonia sp.]
MGERGQHDVVVIGAGQAGLAAGYHLKRAGVDFAILDAETAVGDQWRRRWDSLRLFTPARHDGLPGSPVPGAAGRCPTGRETADYLADYARRWELPVVSGTRVTRLASDADGFLVSTDAGARRARSVVVATGATTVPNMPAVAASLDPRISQLHSEQYREPASVPGERVLVVGYGTSGAQIAMELSHAGRDVVIAGDHTAAIPRAFLAVAGELWWIVLTRVMTRKTPVGRRVAPKATTHGSPLIGISPKDVRAAGVREAGRVESAEDGLPVVDGAALDVDAVVWCTGYRGDFSWIDVPGLEIDVHGFPVALFGLAPGVPGLGFVGMPFQTGLASQLIGGVGDDAAHVVRTLLERSSKPVTT